jgi:succinylglutamate desuccinylase
VVLFSAGIHGDEINGVESSAIDQQENKPTKKRYYLYPYHQRIWIRQ